MTLNDLEKKAERTRLILDLLPEIPQMPGPKFIHAHIINPHPPYVSTLTAPEPRCGKHSRQRGVSGATGLSGTTVLEDVARIIAESDQPDNHYRKGTMLSAKKP